MESRLSYLLSRGRSMHRYLFLAAVLSSGASLCAQGTPPLTADQIMERVAANQDRTEESRKQYVDKQHIHVVSRKTNGKVMQEEVADHDVFPAEHGSSQEVVN